MRTIQWAGLGVAFVVLAACSAPDDSAPTSAADGEVEFVDPAMLTKEEGWLQALELQGYPIDDAVIREHDVVVGGDMVFAKADLEAYNQGVLEKGYFCNGAASGGGPSFMAPRCWAGTKTLHPTVAAKLQIQYDLTFGNLSQGWSWALSDAAHQWSQAHDRGAPGGIYIDADREHPSSWALGTITVTVVAGRCPAGDFACTDGGPRGSLSGFAAQPGNINLEPGNLGGLNTPAKMRHTLQHELGHALGFLHPGNGAQIGGTLSAAALDPDGDGVLATVMDTGALDKPVLEPDDLDSAVTRYPQSSTHNYVPTAWSWDFCTDEFPCDVGEGDCDTDIQCKGLLVCGQNVGVLYGQDASADLCVPSANAGNLVERGACPASGSTTSCAVPGCPCERLEGDCDNDSECGGRLVCGSNNGPAFGKGSTWDFCVEPPNAGCSWFNPSSPNASLCSAGCPCDAGQGDCDSASECRSGLVCGRDLGPSFGLPATYDVCVRASAAVNGTD